jgi:putative methionine-R-sulfoxide reductase with GAF domain
MELPDFIKKHLAYKVFSIIIVSCGLTWVVSNEALVKPKDIVIEQKNACIEGLTKQIESLKIENDRKIESYESKTQVQRKPASFGDQEPTIKYIEDLINSISNKRSGLQVTVVDEKSHKEWLSNLFGMLRDVYHRRQNDVYVAWLKPSKESPDTLKVYMQYGMPVAYSHYEFQLNEGLAGKVWATGTPAATSELKKHPWWVFRDGCSNVSYICVSVGKKAGLGGVLSVGSDKGFEVFDQDINTVRIFADLLTLSSANY